MPDRLFVAQFRQPGKVERPRPGSEVVSGVSALDARGHTRGHLAFAICSDRETLVHTADILCGGTEQFRHPERDVAADTNRLLGAVTRLTMLAQLASDRCLAFAPRVAFPGLGSIVCDGAAFGWRSWPGAASGRDPDARCPRV